MLFTNGQFGEVDISLFHQIQQVRPIHNLQTQVGIDLGGKQLADEVWQIVRQTKGLKRISFLAHSLGGSFSRYAIADLYRLNDNSQGEVDISNVLEMLAATFTSGRTGQQLFLTDGNSNDAPLLLQMAYNCTDGPFM
ncbi:unnamed protein product [Sphagnum jensenii]|uniref:DUF676 domain-containing protein n=1 Tax=Sphagnum jensenii TaxID=128206 RepID=A0ABP1C3J6_9BRYO